MMAKLGGRCAVPSTRGRARADRRLSDSPARSEATVGEAFQSLRYRVLRAGDSYNDIPMLDQADAGFFYCCPPTSLREYPQFPAPESYVALQELLARIRASPEAGYHLASISASRWQRSNRADDAARNRLQLAYHAHAPTGRRTPAEPSIALRHCARYGYEVRTQSGTENQRNDDSSQRWTPTARCDCGRAPPAGGRRHQRVLRDARGAIRVQVALPVRRRRGQRVVRATRSRHDVARRRARGRSPYHQCVEPAAAGRYRYGWGGAFNIAANHQGDDARRCRSRSHRRPGCAEAVRTQTEQGNRSDQRDDRSDQGRGRRKDRPDFIVMARTDALAVDGFDACWNASLRSSTQAPTRSLPKR
jgi:hypothetical protein